MVAESGWTEDGVRFCVPVPLRIWKLIPSMKPLPLIVMTASCVLTVMLVGSVEMISGSGLLTVKTIWLIEDARVFAS